MKHESELSQTLKITIGQSSISQYFARICFHIFRHLIVGIVGTRVHYFLKKKKTKRKDLQLERVLTYFVGELEQSIL